MVQGALASGEAGDSIRQELVACRAGPASWTNFFPAHRSLDLDGLHGRESKDARTLIHSVVPGGNQQFLKTLDAAIHACIGGRACLIGAVPESCPLGSSRKKTFARTTCEQK